jgi:DNA-binding LacI/PurR family transcriptional regulator
MKKKVSSFDVAREAGVSRATVSYILNNVSGVKIKSQTVERVIEVARKLGYHPNVSARALKTKKSMSVGVVSKRSVDEERFTKVLKGIKEVLDKHDYSILICSDEINNTGTPQYYNYYMEDRIDGIILLSCIESIDYQKVRAQTQTLKEENIPSVLVDYHIYDPEINCVDLNYYHGGYLAADYLLNRGYNKVIFLDAGTGNVQENERISGVSKAFADRGLNEDMIDIISVGSKNFQSWTNIYRVIREMGEHNAVIASWVYFGLKVLHIAGRTGISVPRELAVISLADSGYANYCYPRLSTSMLPLHEAGKQAANLLMNTLNGEKVPVNIKLPCTLNIRKSC